MKKESKIIGILGLLVSVVATFFSIYVFVEGGKSGAMGKSLQHTEVELLTLLIAVANDSNKKLESIEALSKLQIATAEVKIQLENATVDAGGASPPLNSQAELQSALEKNAIVLDLVADLESDPVKIVDPMVGETAWIYIGKFDENSKQWITPKFNKTIKNFETANIAVDDILLIDKEVGFNASLPKFPKYISGLKRKFPYSLARGTRVKVEKVSTKVGLNDFTWAKVTILEGP